MVEQSVEIAPEFGSSALHSSLFIIFVACCKYKFNFCKVKSVLASKNDILSIDRQRRRRGQPATGLSLDSLEAQIKRTEYSALSGCRNPVWLTRYVHHTWKIGKGISQFKVNNDFAAHLLSLEMAKATDWLWMNSRVFSSFQSYCLFIWKSTVKNKEFDGQTASNISVLPWMEKNLQHRDAKQINT